MVVVFLASLSLVCSEERVYDDDLIEANFFWSVELPVHESSVTVELPSKLHVTKAAFSISGPPQDLTGKWARVMMGKNMYNTTTNTSYLDTHQICYLSHDYGILSESLDIVIDNHYAPNVTFLIEDDDEEMVMPVVLSGYRTILVGFWPVHVIQPVTVDHIRETPYVKILQDYDQTIKVDVKSSRTEPVWTRDVSGMDNGVMTRYDAFTTVSALLLANILLFTMI